MSYDIITFGSATHDIHLKSKAFKTLKDKKDFASGAGICLNLGPKLMSRTLFSQPAVVEQMLLPHLQNKDLKQLFVEQSDLTFQGWKL